jgi:tetratricopeptide (TPR) repeat protein
MLIVSIKWIRKFLFTGLLLSSLVSPLAWGRPELLAGIEQLLNTGRQREALQNLSVLRQIGDPNLITPRFIFLEAKAMLATGFPEEASARLELLRQTTGWETQVKEPEILSLELTILKSLGQSADALRLLENRLSPLDEIDPPYSETDTQLHLVYADLLLACLKNNEAVVILFDLLKNGDPSQKANITVSLLSAAEQNALNDKHWENLVELLPRTEGMSLWTSFARAALNAKKPEIAREFILTGFVKSPSVLRTQWPAFLEESTDAEALQTVAGWILACTQTFQPELQKDWLALKATTLEKTGKVDEAVQIIRDNLWGDVDLQLRVAKMLVAKGDIDEASKIYAELEAHSPGRFLEHWGAMYADLGITDKALEIWAKIPQQEKRPEIGYLRWGRLLKSRGFLKEALEAFKEGLSRTTQPALFSSELLDVSISMGDVSGALSAYQVLRTQTQRAGGIWSAERLIDHLRRTQQMDRFLVNLSTILSTTDAEKALWGEFAVEMATELSLQVGAYGDKQHGLAAWLDHPPALVEAYWAKDPQRKIKHLLGIGIDLSLQGEHHLAGRFFQHLPREPILANPNALEAAARSATEIGDATLALDYWQALRDLPRIPLDQKYRAGVAVPRLYLKQHQPGKALEALAFLENSGPPGNAGSPNPFAVFLEGGELTYCRAMAYTQLHEKSKALPLWEEVFNGGGDHLSEAQFWLAEWSLWQRDWDQAKAGFEQVLAADPGQELANEALGRLRYMTGLEEEQLPAFALACFFEASGEWKEAEANYRKLAAELGPSDLTDWIYFRIGVLWVNAGQPEEGVRQWQLILEKTQNLVLAARIRYALADLNCMNTSHLAATENADPAGSFEDLLLNNPNTLLGDLAREKMQEHHQDPTPTPKPEMVP